MHVHSKKKKTLNYPLVTRLKMSPEHFDRLYMTMVWTLSDGRSMWYGRTSRLLASEFQFFITEDVKRQIELIVELGRLRAVKSALSDLGYYGHQTRP